MDRSRGTEESWRLTLLHSPIGMGLVGLDGRMLVVNRALCEMLGYEPEQLRSKRFQDITHPEDLPASLNLLKQALAGEIDSLRLLKRYLHADGGVLWVDLSAAPVRHEDGTILHFVTQFLDVTEQHASEARLAVANQELERERQTLEAIFDTVNIGLLLLGPDGSFQRMNRRHTETMSLQTPRATRAGLDSRARSTVPTVGLLCLPSSCRPTARRRARSSTTCGCGPGPTRPAARPSRCRRVQADNGVRNPTDAGRQGRRSASLAGGRQPGLQRGQVHPEGRDDHARAARRRPPWATPPRRSR